MVAELPGDEMSLGYLSQQHLLSQGSHQALCVHLSQTQHVERTAVWTKTNRGNQRFQDKGGRTSTMCMISSNMTFKWLGAFSTLLEKLSH